MTEQEHSAALEKAERERDEATERVAKLEADLEELRKASQSSDEDTTEEIDKADLPEAVRARLEKLEKAEAEASERLAKAEAVAKEERDRRITREFVAKAEEEFSHVPGSPSDLGSLLKSASEKFSKEEFEALETTLKAADKQIEVGGVFAELGKSGDAARDTSDIDPIAKRAEELRKSDPSVSEYDALHRAMRENPEAAASYLASVR